MLPTAIVRGVIFIFKVSQHKIGAWMPMNFMVFFNRGGWEPNFEFLRSKIKEAFVFIRYLLHFKFDKFIEHL